jgi:hypothetical protein
MPHGQLPTTDSPQVYQSYRPSIIATGLPNEGIDYARGHHFGNFRVIIGCLRALSSYSPVSNLSPISSNPLSIRHHGLRGVEGPVERRRGT